MFKKISILVIGLVLIASLSWGAAPVPSYGQITCNGTAVQLWQGGNGNMSGQYFRLAIVPITAGVTVWIAPSSALTTSTAGIPLSTTGLNSYVVDGNPNMPWYCITSGSAATVGYTILW